MTAEGLRNVLVRTIAENRSEHPVFDAGRLEPDCRPALPRAPDP
jgi:hypothetical protein